ncbi:MAG: GPI anchored serine-threonine rich family protein [Melioribacteraceae bacterium]|nr:GPI anchored serine-threonine rich family protein [Melioribacteraceae bacterium]
MKNILLLITILFVSCTQREELIIPEEIIHYDIQSNDLKILSPKYGETWKTGTTQKIKWTLSSEIKKVQIILFKKDNLIEVIANSYPNNGEFNWNIPKGFTNSVHYKIKIIAMDVPRINSTSEYFYIKDDFTIPTNN